MTFKMCKRMAVWLIAVALVIAVTATAAAAETILGDVDSNEKVELIDATYIQGKIAGLRISCEISESAADIDGNGILEIIDATYIQRYLADMATPYPIGIKPTETPTEAPTEAPTSAPTQLPTDPDGWGQIIYRP